MDAKEIRRAVLAARTRTISCGERIYKVRMPSRYEVSVASNRLVVLGATVKGRSMMVVREVLERNMVGWVGVTIGDLFPDAESTSAPVDFDAELVPVLLDALPDDAIALNDAVVEWIDAQADREGAQAKNSTSGSPGPAPAPEADQAA